MAGGLLSELPAWALELIESERRAHLGLLDADGRPRVLPVTYALYDGALWTVIDNKPKRGDREPARVRWLRRRAQAALTVDRYGEDWSRLAWVQILADARILEIAKHPGALRVLSDRYPQYRADPPRGPLIRLQPVRALHWQPGAP